MVTKAKGSQSTGIKSGGGQNKPSSGGKAGAGAARGGANTPSLGKTTPGGRGPLPKAK
jgi:hypothetical protein